MLRKTLIGLAAMALVLPSVTLARHSEQQYAKVVTVEPLYRTVSVEVPHRECWTETVYEQTPGYRNEPQRHSSVMPTLAGGIIGGVIGHQFGGGNGKKAMTVLGTLIGAGVANDHSQRRNQAYYRPRYASVRAVPVERCETSYETQRHTELEAYLVTYRYAGRDYQTRMLEHPGDRIRIQVEVTPA
ncbi:MAG: glycine zipper 2TM domain-containing protein [Gammaproteobacteria bacterium]